MRKNPVIGGILSFICPGAGQLYNEDFVKGIVLIVAFIASIVTIVYSGLNLGSAYLDGGRMIPNAGEIAKIVTAGLLIFVIWLYGIIDAVIIGQRLSAAPAGEVKTPVRTREGVIGLGVVLLVVGVLILLIQMGLQFDLIIRYGWPVALILLGAYLLCRSLGIFKVKSER